MQWEERFLAARKKYIEKQFSSLNDMQRQAAMTTQGPLLLLAGAGSGKTTVLIQRIANLIRFGKGSDSMEIPWHVTEEDAVFLENLPDVLTPQQAHRAEQLCALEPAAPWSILAITFTNKAAGELKSRLETVVGPEANDVWAMTFHAACCRILRRNIDRLGFDGRFTIYDTSDSERIMKEIIKEMNLDDKTFPAKSVLTHISRAKDKMLSPEDFARDAESSGDFRLQKIAKAYATYQKRLKANNALDFDDLLYYTVRLLQEQEDVRQYYQRKFRYVLIDEYQDTNHAQYLMASLLAGYYENICVVGDDDQSIYRFRGATIDNILDFEKQYKGATTIRLEQNYRSTQSILDAANAVISNNQGRMGKRLWTNNGQGQKVLEYDAYNEGEEASFVAGQIIARSKGKGFKNFAVLYRTNAQSYAIEYAFKRNGIPYRIIGGTRFFDHMEIKDMLAYLCVINNPSDDLRLRRIINTPARGIGGKTVEVAERLAQAQGSHLYEVLSDCESYNPLERPAKKIREFITLIEGCQELLREGMNLPDFYEELLIRTGYVAMLEAKPTEENKTRLENVRELKSSIVNYVENTDEPSLAGFLEEIALYTDIEQYDANADAAVMMTMHAAKGLEFPEVFLVGMEDGLFPSLRCIGDATEMEEERRLCYVAITRAKERLTISHARQRMLYGRTNACLPSRFLKEIPEECLEKRGGYQARQEKKIPTEPIPRPAGSYQTSREIRQNAIRSAMSVPKSAAPVTIEFAPGDMVTHTAFGKGMILTVNKMGNDALLEVAFDTIGTKRLMAKAASAHMKKQ